MIAWQQMQQTLANSGATAVCAAAIENLTEQIRSDPWKYADFLAEAGAAEPNLAGLLKRNIVAAEAYLAALKDLRAAVIAANPPLKKGQS